MLLDALRRECLENVVLVFLEDAVGKLAEHVAHPCRIQRLVGLDLDSVALCKLVIRSRAHDGAYADALAVHTVGVLKALGLHLDEVGDKMLCTGGGAAVGEYLHGKTGEHLGVCHGLIVRLLALGKLLCAASHDIQRLLRHGADLGAEILAGDEVSYLPVGNGDILCKYILNAGDGQKAGRTGDDVDVADDGIRRLHGDGLLLTVNDDGADIGGEAVGGDDGGDGDKGDAELPCAVAAEVHQGAAADDDDIIRLALKPGHHVLDKTLLTVQTLRLKDYFLICADMVHGGKIIGVGIIYDGAEAAETAVVHVFVEAFERAVFAYDELGAQLVVAPTLTFAKILCAIENHFCFPPVI